MRNVPDPFGSNHDDNEVFSGTPFCCRRPANQGLAIRSHRKDLAVSDHDQLPMMLLHLGR